MVDSPIARLSSSRALVNFEKVNTNMIQLRTQLNKDTVDKKKFEEKRARLFKKEEESLTGLRAATFNLRTIIGSVSGASALSKFKGGDIGGGLQETGIAIAAFLPEIIGITSNIVVGGLATKGLLGGGTGMAGAPKGKAGLLALPLLALAPLLMGAGRNNQSNAPTSEFRREQELRKTRKNIINSGDTERFGKQLDRFEQILDGMRGSGRTTANKNQSLPVDLTGDEYEDEDDGRDEEGRDKDGKKNIGNQIVDFLSLADPFKGTMDFFKSDEEIMQDSKDTFAIFGTMWDGTKKMFNGIMNMFKPPEAKAGTLDEFLKDGGVLPNSDESSIVNLEKLANTFAMGDDGSIDFTSMLGSTKGKEMEGLMTNFLGVVKTKFVPSSEDDDLLSIANSFNMKSLKPITKLELDTNSLGDVFFPMPSGDSEIPSFVDQGAIEETDSNVGDPVVDVDFKGSVDKFMNRLLLNINR